MAFLKPFVIGLCCIIVAVLAEEQVKHGAGGHGGRRESHFKTGVHNPVFDQEALLGSRHNEDIADLPDDVRVSRLQTLAKSHDTNNNDIIEAEELKHWILQSFKMLDREEAMEKMEEDDEDGDGKVSFPEILQKQYGYTEKELEEMQKQEAAQEEKDLLEAIADDKLRFQTADLNSDGLLDGEEFIAYYQPYDFPHMYGIEMDKAMRDYDKDKDGSISIEEFIGDHDDYDEEHRQTEMSHFQDLDKDKDGKLTREEIKPWVITDNSEVADEEVQHLISECDEDNDGHLSIDEIVNKEDEFISSSATDYGRSLHFVKDEL